MDSGIRKRKLTLVFYILLLVFARVWWRDLWRGIGGIYFLGWVDLVLLVLGVGVGWWMSLVDHVIYFASYPHEVTAQRFWASVRHRQWMGAWDLLVRTEGERNRLVVHGILFQIVMFVFALWMITMGVSSFVGGFLLGMIGGLLVWDLEMTGQGKQKRIFWQVAREIDKREALTVVGVMSFVFVVLTLWVA